MKTGEAGKNLFARGAVFIDAILKGSGRRTRLEPFGFLPSKMRDLAWPSCKRIAGGLLLTTALTSPAQANIISTVAQFADGYDSSEFLAFALIIGTVFCSVTGLAALYQAKRSLIATRRESSKKIAELTSQLEKAEALLGAETSVLVTWNNQNLPEISGDISRIPGMPLKSADVLRWHGWLSHSSADAMSHAAKALVERGEACRVLLQERMGDVELEAVGRVVAGRAVLRLRDISQTGHENARLTDRLRQLEHENHLSRVLMESLPMPIWMRNREGELRWANHAFVSMVERTSLEDAIKHHSWLLSHDERVKLEALRNPEGFLQGTTKLVSQGAQRLIQIYDLRDSEGRAGIAIDVSEAEQARRELERHINAHKRTLDQIKSAIAIFNADQTLVFYNDAYRQLWRLDADWLDSHPTEGDILDRLRASHALPEHTDYRRWKTEHLAAYHSPEPRSQRWHLPDGQTLDVVGEPHPFGGVIYLFENETETLALQRGFNALEQTQRETLDNLREGIVVFGSSGKVSLFNPAFAKMWKLQASQLEAAPHVDELMTWCAPLVQGSTVWQQVKRTVTGMDERRVRQGGELVRTDRKVLDYVTVPMPGGSTLLAFVDVTAARNVANMLREKNEALETADKIKTNFIQHISYELRSPLTSVIGFTELLADENSGPLSERQQGYANDILSSSHVLMTLIDDILDLAGLDAGVVELNPEKIAVADLLSQVTASLSPKLKDSKVHVEVDIAHDLPPFEADPQRLKQVLYNLLSNAIAHSKAEACVRVQVLPISGSIAFKVIDEGSGIDEKDQAQVFDSFFATHSTNAGRGAGLGLTIVKSFVELHGGSVALTSKKDQGTTVTCLFPPQVAEASVPALDQE